MGAGFAVLWVAIRAEPWVFTISTLGSLLFGALTVADAWVLGWATDHVLLPAFANGVAPASGLIAVAALFIGVALLRAVGIVARRFGAGVMQYRMQAAYRREVTGKYLTLPMSWHHRHPTGQLLSNANSDVEAAWAPIAPLPMAVGTVAMIVVAVVQMMLTDLVMAAVGLLVFPLVVLANLAYQRLSSPIYTQIQETRAVLSEIAHESFEGAVVVKTLGREGEETIRFSERAHELRELGIRAGRIRAAFDPVLEGLPNLGVLAVLAVGVWRVAEGAAAPGAVVTIAYLLTIVAFPIRSIGWLLGEFPRSVVGFRRVQGVLSEQEAFSHGTKRIPSTARGAHLQVEGLGFNYDSGPAVLSDLNLEVRPGQTVALVGETAAGKSTISALVMRLMDPQTGRVLIDGVDLRDLAPGALAEHVVLVPQTAFLFDDSVRGNVTLGGEYTDEQVWQALRMAQADSFVSALPSGLDSQLGERGTSLSGGQRQRIALARALIRRPRLLILDDATSAVDPEVESRILHSLRHGDADDSQVGSMLLIAYRKATISLADEVAFLAAGRVIDQGPHETLLAANPDYANLVNAYQGTGTHP
ncbi:MAG TPA: ABC transporter ATP-binding protein, partial [Marmoricola sp.]|nr:ABC transporter ATP-binding protein [Marmoricola sp.]